MTKERRTSAEDIATIKADQTHAKEAIDRIEIALTPLVVQTALNKQSVSRLWKVFMSTGVVGALGAAWKVFK